MADRRQLGYVSAYTTVTAYAEVYGVATGGTAFSTPPTGYSGLSFTADGTLTVTTAGLFEIYALGGGGGGGAGGGGYSVGGGGAGARLRTTVYLSATTYAVTIGAGGAAGAPYNGVHGGVTKLGSIISVLGGGAGNRTTQNIVTNADSIHGGCGGGGGDEWKKSFR